MNKTLIALLIVGLTATTAGHAQESSTQHNHDEHKSSTEHEHDDHKSDKEHAHDDDHQSEAEHKHDDHKASTGHEHDDHKSDKEHAHHDDHSSETKGGHDDHQSETKHKHDDHKASTGHEHDDHKSDKEHAHNDDHSTQTKGGHDDHSDEHGHGGHEESSSASLNTEQLTLAGIRVEALSAKPVNYQLYAPGEILSNGYTSYRVSPRVASVVLRRHVALGDHVKQGQPLVTLFSENVAQAQASYRTAWPEWKRVRELGRKTVGEKRYINAKTDFEAAQATLQAFGLTSSDLRSLTSQKTLSLGEYTLRAEIDGAVLTDDFEQGQRIDAGAPLITLADEKQLWVEAHLSSKTSLTLGAGTQAEVVAGDVRVKATVTQEAHTIDPVTRTRTVRLLVDNAEHRLHPGQFAEVFFRFRTEKPVLAVPETALMRSADGDWTVFVEDHPGEFQPVEVELHRSLGQLREISGIEPNTRIVTKGAFFVASQIAKGGFDPHNH
ncbi:MAG: efflux RND transporter periplasmic adaptor subunit [Cellvibrionaceae bacterium]